MITENPKIKLYEEDSSALNRGVGGQIPIFVSPTMNDTPVPDIVTYTKYSDAAKLTSAGGIGTADTNILLPILQDFFEESLKINNDDIGVSRVHVKDLGTAVPSTATPWTNAIKDVKVKDDVQVEAYIFQKPANANAETVTALTTSVVGIMTSVATELKKEAGKGKLRIAYFTILGYTEEQLKELTKTTNATKIQESRVYLMSPENFGKRLARICTTPYYDEPGYYAYRTVEPGVFDERTDETEESLREAGIVFDHDEKINSATYPKINLCVATSYAKGDERPLDSLLHVRRNVDQLVREAVDIVYHQLKRRETAGYLSDTQANLDLLVHEKVEAGYMRKNTSITVIEDENAPEKLTLITHAYPVNITGLIEMTTYIH
ncbi:hypothetical protein [Methanobrevibacter sp.]|uniref:hypothetical protein n=1 Tax=Methanobrevibacter sp. TaxID=66852 RepID=UPI00388EC2FD